MEADPTTSFHCAIYNYWLGVVKKTGEERTKKEKKNRKKPGGL